MIDRRCCILPLLLLFSGLALAQPTVRFHTSQGDIDVMLLPNSAPKTVENFMKYVNRGTYSNTLIHRSARKPINATSSTTVPFVIQGGGYQFVNGTAREIVPDGTVDNEYAIANARGTLAMAKTDAGPNTASNQWFFNVSDNSLDLNQTSNGGFTVFGRITNSAGLGVMDNIARLPTVNLGGALTNLPLRNYTNGAAVMASNLVLVTSIEVLGAAPAIREKGAVSASNFGGMTFAAPGSYIEIYGSDLAEATRSWEAGDFSNGKAPTTLEGVSVTVNGQVAFISYVSPSQVNVQVPANVPAGGSVPVVVRFNGQASPAIQVPIRATAGGILAPATFKVEDRQYVAALHAGTENFVSNGRIPNVPADPAKPGETLLFYGVGFGPVTPASTPAAGQIATELTSINNPVEFRFGDAVAQVTYAGLAPNFVGLYQFNVVVPPGVTSGDVPLGVTVAGEAIQQNLYISVQ